MPKVLWENVVGHLSHLDGVGQSVMGTYNIRKSILGGDNFESLQASERDTILRCGDREKKKTNSGHKGKRVWGTEEVVTISQLLECKVHGRE